MSPILTWLISHPRLAGAIALVIVSAILWLADSGKFGNVSGILAWFRKAKPNEADVGFDKAFAALDEIQAVNANLKNTRIGDLLADLADELTHSYYPRVSVGLAERPSR